MQREIFVQCLCNMGAFVIPLLVQALGYKTGELTVIEYFGWILWLSSIAFEHTADLQKKKFVRDCIKNKVKNAVCDVGLWRYRYLIFMLFNNRFLRKRGMASTPKMEYQVFDCIFQKNSAMATSGLKEMGKFLQT